MINLLPSEIKDARSYGRKNKTLFGFTIVVFLTALSVAGVMVGSINLVARDQGSLEDTLAVNDQQVIALERDISELKNVADRLEAADKLYEENVAFSELIPEIGSILPQGAIINGLSLSGGVNDPLSLSVSITEADLAAVLQRNLVDSELFEAADVNSISPIGGDSATTYNFNADVRVSFTGSAEERAREAAAAAAAAEALANEGVTQP